MAQLITLGAKNKLTGEYIYPKIANKKDKYICPDCEKDLIVCKGEIRVHHFRHKVDTINPCNHYNSPTESEIHKDAKLLMKTLLDKKTKIMFIRKCCSCKQNEEINIKEMSETSKIELEHRFFYNGIKIADVAHVDNGEIKEIFEICNSHKTQSENRPDPWYEIDALTLINLVNESNTETIKIPCIRCEKCEKCKELDKNKNYETKERENYRNAISQLKKSNNMIFNFNYETKYRCGWGYKGSKLDFVIKCDKFVDELINNFELNVYIKKEIEKKIFEECYYLKYYKSIKALKIYGDNFIHVENWGGWNGSENIVDGCSKPVMYKFIKYYKLTNPMTINKLYRQDNDPIDRQPSAPEVPLASGTLVLPTSHIKNNTFDLEHIINSYKPRRQNLPKIQDKKNKINKRNIILDMLVAEMNDKMNKENDEEIKKKINMLLTENNEV